MFFMHPSHYNWYVRICVKFTVVKDKDPIININIILQLLIFRLLSESDRGLMCQLSKEQIYTMIDGDWVRSIQSFRKGKELHERLKQLPDLPLSKQQRKLLNRYRHLVSIPQAPPAQPTLR